MTQDKPKIALVTGASRGLGKNTALAVAKKGVGVIVTYLNSEAEAKSIVSEIEAMGNKAVALQLDIGSIETLDAFVIQVKQPCKTLGTLSNLISSSITLELVAVHCLQK
jgi:NAD(P)-dependent dehydrogenase (short-subunit alcohol dehydrogenase family)